MPKKYSSEPNTRINLRTLSSADIFSIINIARKIGLDFSDDVPSVSDVRTSITEAGELELRTVVDFGKLILTTKPLVNVNYLHAYVTYNSSARVVEDADKVFDRLMRQQFIPSLEPVLC